MRVLVADDDRVFQVLLRRTLSQWGYEPVVVGTGEDAWQQLSRPDGPAIAILDWVMPLADGLEVCRRVRSGNLTRYVYLILLTSKAKSEDLTCGLEAGADDYLSKPVGPDELRLRLRAACRVLESETRHRHIAENASDGIVTLEHDNRIHFANTAAGAIFGYPRTELIGLDLAVLAPDFQQHLGGAGRSQSCDPIEIVGIHRSGRNLLLEVSFSESRHAEPHGGLTAMIRDVTERRRLEERRMQAQKLASIGQLAAGVAHEINTPIQYIGDNLQFIEQSYASLQRVLQDYQQLYSQTQSGPAVRKNLVSAIAATGSAIDLEFLTREMPCAISDAQEGVKQVAHIVRAMKEFAHPVTVEMAPTDVNHLIESTVLVSRNQWKYVADLTVDLDPALPPVTCVAVEVRQVLLNLIVNAADAIADTLRGRPGVRGTIKVVTRALADGAEIRVTDSGTGIPPEVQSRMFDLFFTTKDVGKGSGQGLALAYASIVKKHHGTIDFETEAGKGTTFVIRLPSSSARSAPAASADSHESASLIRVGEGPNAAGQCHKDPH